ncbi:MULTISPECIES: SURF1 family protein [unclassified Microbacterium]|uniref:SURF1 family cytochrome oxidase biogenesis protein n=1 Tax=unclassified Microbacterium TaxID=2609290 RepID=UPI00214BEBBB|nr:MULTISPECIES: SURF1 family protein [unclassified Microbacterium]MCR2785790.1 SURF1 family protein [Microbacterium sp. zg.B96]MDL5350093.1 SURF1 family protein [Microbacterium sp. zg-YB36]WIM17230.1 SURF1 family protein [Microbacterium sp. zg-B96]
MPTAARWAGYVAVAIVFAIACAYLSQWQFDRNEARSTQLELVAENYDATPVPLAELLPAGGEFDPGDQWHPVTLVGEYDTASQLLVRNRPHGGTSAYEVLVPFHTDDGRVLLVDRGWVRPGSDQPEPDVVPAAPEGPATVVVRLKAGEALPTSGRSAPEGQVPTIHLPLIADQIDGGDDLVRDAYGLLISEDPAPATVPNAIASPSEDPGPHLSYAIQWILFAIMGFIFIAYMIRSELRHRREDAADRADAAAAAAHAGDPDAPAPRPARRPRPEKKRRDRDAEAEDALLDTAGR